MIRKILLVSFSLGPILLTGCAEEQATPERPRLVLAMKIGDPSTFEDRWVPGRAKAKREVDLSFRVGGRMIARPVVVGDELKKGDLVAKLDPTDFEVELQNAEGNLDKAEAEIVRAQSEFDRRMRIFKQDPGAISKSAIDKARQERDAAKAGTKALEAAVSDAKNRLDRTTLTAPFASTVVARYAEAFEDVRPKQPIVRLVDKSKVKFEINIPERDISIIPDVTNIRVQIDAFPGLEVPAEILEIGTEASQTTRTYPVTLLMDQPEGYTIQPGMAGRAIGELKDDPTGITLPLTAVLTEEAGSQAALQGQVGASPPPAERPTFVWIVDETDMSVKRRRVVPEAITARGMRLKEGVKTGEWVVTAGVYSLVEGQKVRISQQRPE